MDQQAEVRTKIIFDVTAAQRSVAGLAAELKKTHSAQELLHKAGLAFVRQQLESGSLLTRAYQIQRREHESTRQMLKVRAEEFKARRDYLTSPNAALDARASLRDAVSARQIDRLDRSRQLAARGAYVGTPDHLAEVRAEDRLRREEQRQQARERRAENVARYGGVLGGAMNAAQSPGGRFGFNAAAVGAGTVFGTAMHGFSGTTQMERLNWEFTLLSRELAGAMLPAIELVTAGLNRLRKWLEKLSPRQQDAIMYGTLGVLGLKAASSASQSLFGMGLTQAAGTALGSIGGRAAGGGVGAAGAGALGTAGGAVAARGGGSMLARFGPPGLAAAAVVAAFASAHEGYYGENRYYDYFRDKRADDERFYRKDLERKYGKGTTAVEQLAGVNESYGKVRAFIGGTAAELYDNTFGLMGGPTYKERFGGPGGKAADRRKVTPMLPTLFDQPGGAWERVALDAANLSGLNAQADAGMAGNDKATNLLEEIRNFARDLYNQSLGKVLENT